MRKAGDARRSHIRISESIYAVTVNGTPCSEALLNAALAGSYGVPVVLITGDRTIVEETTRAMPWAVGVAVKDAIGYSAVNSLTPQAAQRGDSRRRARSDGPYRARAAVSLRSAVRADDRDGAASSTPTSSSSCPASRASAAARCALRRADYPRLLEAFIAATRIAAAAESLIA